MRQALLVLITTLGNIFTLLIIADMLMSWIFPPYHPARETLGRILAPVYDPIRRLIPPVGMFDFTPVIVLVIFQVVEQIAISLLR